MNPIITIRESRPGAPDFRYFEQMPAKVYAAEASRFTAKESLNEACLLTCVMAFVEDDIAGRLCVYFNPYIKIEDKPCLLIGNFEALDNPQVCRALIRYVEQMAADKSISYIVGPVNGSTWDDYRFPLTESTDPYLTDSRQPAYYARMFLEAGFSVLHRYYTGLAAHTGDKKVLQGDTEYLTANHITVRHLNPDVFEQELQKVYELCIVAFRHNPMYSPVNKAYFVRKYMGLKHLIDPDFVLLAERGGKLVGLYFCLLDVYKRRIVIKTIAKHPDCGVKGLMDIMGKMIYQTAFAKGYGSLVHAYMHEQNRSRVLSENFYGTVMRTYAVFFKQVML